MTDPTPVKLSIYERAIVSLAGIVTSRWLWLVYAEVAIAVFGWFFGVFARVMGWEAVLEKLLTHVSPELKAVGAWLFSGYSAAVAIALVAWVHGYKSALKNHEITKAVEAKERRLASIQSTKRYHVGMDMGLLGAVVQPDRLTRFTKPLDQRTKTKLMGLHASAEKLGLPMPPIDQMLHEDNRLAAGEFLVFVGHLVEQGNFDRALEHAKERLRVWPARLEI